VVIAVDVSIDFDELPGLLEAQEQRLPLTQIPLVIETLRRTVGVMEKQINAQKLAEARPEVLIQPALDNGITLFTGFNQAAECIAAGEEAATLALPRIQSSLKTLFGPRHSGP
jgi:predicted acylesterase/phospholipase RssA